MSARYRTLFVAMMLFTSFQHTAAQSRRLDDEDRSVDKVVVRDGLTLYGAILGRSADGTLTMAVDREWLKAKSKRFYADQTENEAANAIARLETLRDRIDAWRTELSAQKNLPDRSFVGPLDLYLKEQRESVEQKLKEARQNDGELKTQFVLLELPEKQVRRGFLQPEQNRKVALAAWKSDLKDVENSSTEALLQELRDRNVEVDQLDLDLSKRLPPHAGGEREWAARRAIVEHQFWMSLEFQGTKSYLVETGRERPDLTKLLPELLNQELSRQLSDLLELPGGLQGQKTDPIAKATKTADENRVYAVVISQLDQNLTQNWVSVEKTLLAKMPGENWERVWSTVAKVDASRPRKAIEEELADHEQIKQIRDAVKVLGLPVGEEHLGIAIRFGAATMEAQKQSNDAFDAFVKSYVEELDRPPLILGAR